ncbi:MAG TPA: hypothetical protein VM266_12070 [Solirubrobacteraceae bacterium]|nr:hypothetical protein [Solirubrobacteraceae bacterium]
MRRVILVAAAALAVAATAMPAQAAPVTIKKGIWGPVTLGGVSQFPVYADLGVGIFHMAVRWDQVAPARPADPSDPADPAYAWPPEVDQAIQEAGRYGIRVSVMLVGSPPWANGGRAWNWAPRRPADFAAFATAASRRWPAVRHWLVWGEPTKASNWQPLVSDRGRPLRTARQRRGPRLYARVLDAAYAALKRVARRNLVIGGNTYTVGTVRPLHFIRALRLPNGRPPRMDLWGHNPFSLRRPDLSARPLGSGYADFSDLDTLAAKLDRARRRMPPSQRRLRIFISEYSLPTGHPNVEFNFYVSEQRQADWIARALRIARSWRRIYSFGYLGLYDDPERADGRQVERGLIRRDGTRKPAYRAYRDG